MRTPAAMAMMSLIVAGCTGTRLADGRPAAVTATYDCGDGRVVTARFDNVADRLTLTTAEGTTTLHQQRAGSGIWYVGEGAELRGKGSAATIVLNGRPAMECTAR